MPESIQANDQKPSVAVIGGGITGIVAALYLARSGGFNVTLFEKEDALGGLSRSYRWRDVVWDRFYHVILSTDLFLLEFLDTLGLKSEITWCDSKSGFYDKGKLVSFSSAWDFLLFPFLSIWQKFRLAAGIIFCSRIKDPKKLDRIYVRQWLTGIFGRRVYEQFWDPLLRSKLGSAREKTSGAFMWATIRRMYGSRSAGSKKEKMGYVEGGYDRILKRVESELTDLGVNVATGHRVIKVTPEAAPAPNPNSIAIMVSESFPKQEKPGLERGSILHYFDSALLTVPCPSILQLVENPGDHPYWTALRKVRYLSVVCVLLILTRRLSPYYVINLLDKSLPFTGIIEVTNVISPQQVGNKHVVYLPKYFPIGDPTESMKDEEIAALFTAKLMTVYPDLKAEEILHRKVFREKYVQPLHDLNHFDCETDFQSPLENIFVVNSSMIDNSNLNNNAVIRLAKKAVKKMIDHNLD